MMTSSTWTGVMALSMTGATPRISLAAGDESCESRFAPTNPWPRHRAAGGMQEAR